VLVSAGADNIIKVWDVPGQKLTTELKGHELGVTGVAFAGDNKTLVSVSQDRTIRVWDVSIAPPKEPKKDEPKKDAAKDKKDPKKEEPKKKDEPKKDEPKKDPKADPPVVKDPRLVKEFGPTPDDLYGVSWSKDTKTIATAGYAGNLSVWNLTDPKPTFTTKIKDVTYCVAFAPDGKTIVAGHEKGEITLTKR
jgi:WD40 repeat protein